MRLLAVLVLFLFSTAALAEVFFEEDFDDGWEQRWVVSKHRSDVGEFGTSAGKFLGNPEDKGLQTKQDARFYQISAETKEFNNRERNLVIQYSVKHEQNIDCGGAYIKLLPAGINQEDFSGDSKYNIMFGPDICGSIKRLHVIFNYKGKNHLLKQEIKPEHDEVTHIYTLIVFPNNTYEVKVDNKQARNGSLFDDWDFLGPKEVYDPDAKKPDDWVDEREIPDPTASKPEGWDDVPKQIKDKDSSKPEDWDSELDGEWESPYIDNPEYKGEWKHPMIPNPAYSGVWLHPKTRNPDYKEDPELGKYDSHKYLGLEIWQVKAGTIFDKFLVTDSVELAEERAAKHLESLEAEKAAKEIVDAEKRSKIEADLKKEAESEAGKLDEEDLAKAFADAEEGFEGEDDEVHDEL